MVCFILFFFFKQKTAYEMRISDWSSDVCSSDLSKRAFYSNYGSTVEIAAPGGGVYPNDGSSGTPINDGFIWQAINDGTKEPADAYAYLGMAGTSQAAPHVSGVVALMQGARADAGLPALTPDEVLSIIQTTAHAPSVPRSEEHTSELQSLMRISYAVFCLEKKKHNYT